MVFKAADNYFSDASGMTNLLTLRIHVAGSPPSPPEVKQFVDSNVIICPEVYRCSNSGDFAGWAKWCKDGRGIIPGDSCLPNPSDYGYSEIGFLPENTSLPVYKKMSSIVIGSRHDLIIFDWTIYYAIA